HSRQSGGVTKPGPVKRPPRTMQRLAASNRRRLACRGSSRKRRRKLFSLSLHRRALVLIHRLDGHDYADDGAAAQFAFRFDVAAVELGNVFENGQAETGATQFAAAGLVRAKESFEDTRQVLFADPNSFILDAQDNLGVAT